MANKKISELLEISQLSESQKIIIPLVVDGTTRQIDSEPFTQFINRDNPTTGSNTFIGSQTITGSITVTSDSLFKNNLVVEGRITAQEFYSEYVSSSVIYESGSTKFGDTLDDTHQWTGSLRITGSLTTNGVDIYRGVVSLNSITSSLFLATQSLYVFTQSANLRLSSIEGYTASLKSAISVSGNTFSAYNVGISGSLTVTGSTNISGSLTTVGDMYPNGIRVGRGAGNSIANTVLGYNAGNSNTTGIGNIFIGNGANTSNGASSNQIVIGSGSVGLGANSTVIGNALTTQTYIPGTLLLGSPTISPQYARQLQVVGAVNATSILIDSASNSNITYPLSLQTNRSEPATYIENLSTNGFGLILKSAANNDNYVFDARGNGDASRLTVLSNGRVLIGAQDNALHRLIVTGSVYADYLNGIQTQTFVTTNQVISEGVIGWDDGNGTLALGLKGGNVTLQIGQEQLARVFNEDTVPLIDGMIVYITGAQGNRVSVKRASAIAELGSASTLGMVTEPIAVGAEGFITTQGVVNGLNTIGLSEGALLFLSETPGQYTPIRPIAPSHTVVVGFVQRVHASVGSIFVKIDNGYEIDELHNVVINTGSQSYGDLLMRSGSVWTNTKQLSGSYSITGSIIVTGAITGSTNFNTLVNKPTLVSGSSQITYGALTGIPAGIVSSSGQIVPLLPIGTVSGSSQITISSTAGYTTFSGSLKSTDDSLSTRISYFETRFTGSSATFNSGLQTIISIATGSNTSIFFNYTLLSGSNTRAGQFMTVWSGNQIQFTDVSTLDIGDTSNVILTSSLSGANVVLTTTLPSNGWTIKTMANLL